MIFSKCFPVADSILKQAGLKQTLRYKRCYGKGCCRNLFYRQQLLWSYTNLLQFLYECKSLFLYNNQGLWPDKELAWQIGNFLIKKFEIVYAIFTFGHEWQLFRNINLQSDEKHQHTPKFSFTRTSSSCSRSVPGRYKRNQLRLLSVAGNKVNWIRLLRRCPTFKMAGFIDN